MQTQEMTVTEKDFILASSSPQRRKLLEQIGYRPKKIQPADIDESIYKYEKPAAYVKRMALEKARKVAALCPGENVLASDTVVVVNTKILQKAQNDEEQIRVMKLLSGKAHRVLSAVCLISRDGRESLKLSTTRILMKKLSEEEIRNYVAGREWVGCCGYKIEGELAAYVRKIIGSYSGVVGLPLYETRNMLNGAGVK